jgi:hypothetical protein
MQVFVVVFSICSLVLFLGVFGCWIVEDDADDEELWFVGVGVLCLGPLLFVVGEVGLRGEGLGLGVGLLVGGR